MTPHKHNPLIAGSVLSPSGVLQVINCANWRTDGSAPSCTIGKQPGISQCAACQLRLPLVSIPVGSRASMPPTMRLASSRWRGMGDAVAALIRVLFLGRVDIAQRMAAWVERKFGKTFTHRVDTPGIPGASGGCGCKKRQEALNRAIPFGNGHANRLHKHDGFTSGSLGQDDFAREGSAGAARQHADQHQRGGSAVHGDQH